MMNFSLIKMFGSWTQLFKSVGEKAEIPQGAWMIMVQYGYLVESLILSQNTGRPLYSLQHYTQLGGNTP